MCLQRLPPITIRRARMRAPPFLRAFCCVLRAPRTRRAFCDAARARALHTHRRNAPTYPPAAAAAFLLRARHAMNMLHALLCTRARTLRVRATAMLARTHAHHLPFARARYRRAPHWRTSRARNTRARRRALRAPPPSPAQRAAPPPSAHAPRAAAFTL